MLICEIQSPRNEKQASTQRKETRNRQWAESSRKTKWSFENCLLRVAILAKGAQQALQANHPFYYFLLSMYQGRSLYELSPLPFHHRLNPDPMSTTKKTKDPPTKLDCLQILSQERQARYLQPFHKPLPGFRTPRNTLPSVPLYRSSARIEQVRSSCNFNTIPAMANVPSYSELYQDCFELLSPGERKTIEEWREDLRI